MIKGFKSGVLIFCARFRSAWQPVCGRGYRSGAEASSAGTLAGINIDTAKMRSTFGPMEAFDAPFEKRRRILSALTATMTI
jgi:membrane-bound ClpP family serine protease